MHVRIETGYDSAESQESLEESIFIPWLQLGKLSPTYTRLLELIEHCGEPYDGELNDAPLLACPLYRASPFSLKDLSRAAVYRWCNYYSHDFYSIDSLQIPEELKLYLKEFGYFVKLFE